MSKSIQSVLWTAAVLGGALLFWKAESGLTLFIYHIVTGTLDADSAAVAVLPDFLITLSGFWLIALSQVISLWCANPERRIFGIIRGALALGAGVLFLRANSLIIRAFQTLGVSGGNNPEKFRDALSETTPFAYAGIACLAISAICGGLGARGKTARVPGGRLLRMLETAGWGIQVCLLTGLILFFSGLDSILVQPSGAADPASLAGLISRILIGNAFWQFALILTGTVALISALKGNSSRMPD